MTDPGVFSVELGRARRQAGLTLRELEVKLSAYIGVRPTQVSRRTFRGTLPRQERTSPSFSMLGEWERGVSLPYRPEWREGLAGVLSWARKCKEFAGAGVGAGVSAGVGAGAFNREAQVARPVVEQVVEQGELAARFEANLSALNHLVALQLCEMQFHRFGLRPPPSGSRVHAPSREVLAAIWDSAVPLDHEPCLLLTYVQYVLKARGYGATCSDVLGAVPELKVSFGRTSGRSPALTPGALSGLRRAFNEAACRGVLPRASSNFDAAFPLGPKLEFICACEAIIERLTEYQLCSFERARGVAVGLSVALTSEGASS